MVTFASLKYYLWKTLGTSGLIIVIVERKGRKKQKVGI